MNILRKPSWKLTLMTLVLLVLISFNTIEVAAIHQDATMFASEQMNDVSLNALEPMQGDFLGSSVAISGNTLVVGAPGDDDNGSFSGAAYVFVAGEDSWSQQAKLLPDDGETADSFGNSVAISEDTIVVGASQDDNLGDRSGAAYIFVRNGTSWSQQAKLTAVDGIAGGIFGAHVAISGDTVVISALAEISNGTRYWAAYVFTRNGTNWEQQSKLTAADTGDSFGNKVAISGDTLLIGASGDDSNGSFSGAAHVFVRTGTNWSHQAKLVASDSSPSDFFGGSVAMSEDEVTVVIGAPGDNDNGSNSGSAYVFVRNGSSWSQQTKLLPNDGNPDDAFGLAVGISGDMVAVGAPNVDVEGTDPATESGAVYLFARSGSSWSLPYKLAPKSPMVADAYGEAVAVSDNTIVIGAPDANGVTSGDFYIVAVIVTPSSHRFRAHPVSSPPHEHSRQ